MPAPSKKGLSGIVRFCSCLAAVAMTAVPTLGQSDAQFPLAVMFAVHQDAPVQVIRSARAADQNAIGRFRLLNNGPSPVVAVRLGWTVVGCGTTIEEVQDCPNREVILRGLSSTFPLLVGSKSKSAVLFFPISTVGKIREQLELKDLDLNDDSFDMYVGVTWALFADGSEWEYDLVNEGDWNWDKKALGGHYNPEGSFILVQSGPCGKKCTNQCVIGPRNACCVGSPGNCGTGSCAHDDDCQFPASLPGSSGPESQQITLVPYYCSQVSLNN